ncbi:hypothetical protein HMPREF1112_0070 [Streptococcus pseudopneumoniae SK674]|nr:hypothetical protein HMPREF1112_0070 [Streptococcus pseudopneumoniae SK674]
MGLFFYTKIGSIISIGDLPTTNIIEPEYTTDGLHLSVAGYQVLTKALKGYLY